MERRAWGLRKDQEPLDAGRAPGQGVSPGTRTLLKDTQ